jgi:toxin ParE1/3/4
MEVRWSLHAADDLERICDRIQMDSPQTARTVAEIVYERCARLSQFPHLGRASVRLEVYRELVFPNLPFIAVYQVGKSAIEISRIFHGAQDWP